MGERNQDVRRRSTIVELYSDPFEAQFEDDVTASSESLPNRCQGFMRRYINRKTIEKRLPVLVWIRQYSLSWLLRDLIAGVTVGLMTIPQALAYAIVAGLPPNYGLYSAFMGSFVYFFFGSTKELLIGPTAVMALMTLHYTHQGGPEYAVLLCFISGVLELFAGIANLGFLINYISQPVISGFTSAAAIAIASSQLKNLLGLQFKASGIIDMYVQLIRNIEDFRWQDLTLGVVCIIILIFMKEMSSMKCSKLPEGGTSKKRKLWRGTVFMLSLSRNALIVIIVSVVAFCLGEDQPFTLTGHVKSGVPTFELPPFTTEVGNTTMSFVDIMQDVGVGVVIIPFIAILDEIAILSAFAKGKTFDAKQEIIALGMINILGSFFRSMPTTASLSRTAVNVASGVKTPAAGIVTGVIVLLALAYLTPYFMYIPKAALAAVIICAVIHMIDYEVTLDLWRCKRLDLLVLLLTFFGCIVWSLEWGIILGIAVNVAILLYFIAKPTVQVTLRHTEKSHGSYIHVVPSHGAPYPSTMHLRTAIQKAGIKLGKQRMPVVVDCYFLVTADYTSARGLKGMTEEFLMRKQKLIFMNLSHDVMHVLRHLNKNLCYCEDLSQLEDLMREDHPEDDRMETERTKADFDELEMMEAADPLLRNSSPKC